jgi:hypothetical protein
VILERYECKKSVLFFT